MKSTLKSALLAAALVTLAAPINAQNNGSADGKVSGHSNVAPHKSQSKKSVAHSAKATRGEAASLESKEAGVNAEEREMRDDNRGRLTSASHHPPQRRPNQDSTAVHHSTRNPAHNATVRTVNKSSQQHGATLKTGQLTTSHGSHLETKEAALHHPIHSDHEQDRTLTPDDPPSSDPQNKNTNPIHLKKHNARMF